MSAASRSDEAPQPKVPLFLLGLGFAVPTLITWIYFVALGESEPRVQQLAFAMGKGVQTLVLVIAAWYWLKPWLRSSVCDVRRVTKNRWMLGLATGLVIGISIIAAYWFLLLPAGIMDLVKAEGGKKLEAFGGKSPSRLILMGAFYSLIHSGFEEVYWRGFVQRACLGWCKPGVALLVSSLGFMSHHVLVLGKYFGYDSVWMYLCAAGVAVGGAIWGWMVTKTGSLLPSWLSHGLVDASIFCVGYHLVFVLA
jgi:uncharacterized protein